MGSVADFVFSSLVSSCNIIQMKSEQEFDFQEDIIQELKLNEKNRIQIFGPNFSRQIHKQKGLKLTTITDSATKGLVLGYLQSPEVQDYLRNALANDPLIPDFINLEEAGKNCLMQRCLQALREMNKKAINDDEPITFYNDYVGLHREIQSCFQPRIAFASIRPEPTEQFEQVRRNKLKCQFPNCGKSFKKRSGLNSHKKFCRFGKNSSVPPSEPSTRTSAAKLRPKAKPIHKTD